MLIQYTQSKKLSFITIAFLILGLSILSAMPAQAGEKFIGPKGGEIYAGNNSYLIIPAGALGDEAAALEALDNAIALLEDQYAYIDGLSTVKNHPSGEWAWVGCKSIARSRSKSVKKYSNSAKTEHTKGRAEDAWEDANKALTRLDYLRTYVADSRADAKIGIIAHDKIQQQNDQIEQELTFAGSQLGKEIEAESDRVVITIDDAATVSGLNTALSLIDSQYTYIKQLSKKDDGSGEWATSTRRASTYNKNKWVGIKVKWALNEHNMGDSEDTLDKTGDALDKLDELDAYIDSCVNVGKMGSVARDKIRAYSDEIRATLEEVISLHYATLVFEFGPHGTEFLVSAELVVPWDNILCNDGLFWYSEDDGETLDLIDIDFFIDEVNETVDFFIDHFSIYYYRRR